MVARWRPGDIPRLRGTPARSTMGRHSLDGGPPLPAGNAQQANGAVSALVKNEERLIGIPNLGALFPCEAGPA